MVKRASVITKVDYFRKMKETKKDVYKGIIDFVNREYSNDILKEKILLLAKRREKKSLARPFIVRLAYELAGGKDWKKTILPGILLEIENLSNYQSNAVFDNKYGVVSNEIDKTDQIISAFLSRNLIQSIIDTDVNRIYGHQIALEFSKLVNEIDVSDYIGQFNEIHKLGAKDFDFKIGLSDYLKVYMNIKYLYGGIWIKNCLLTGLLFAENKTDSGTKYIVQRFGVYCGTPYTIINDISDYCISNVERGFKVSIHDQFKDVWNGRVTLPLYYVFSSHSKSSKEDKLFLYSCLMGKTKKNITNIRRILKILIKSGSLDYCYSVMNFLRKRAREIIKKLPQSEERDYLLLLNSVLRTNKFVSELREQGMKLIDLDLETISFLRNFDKNIVR